MDMVDFFTNSCVKMTGLKVTVIKEVVRIAAESCVCNYILHTTVIYVCKH